MDLSQIAQLSSWEQAFGEAKKLLASGKLTAVAIVSKQEYATGRYVATHLDEFAAAMGSRKEVLDNLRQMSPMLYEGAKSFRLLHGPAAYQKPDGVVNGWILAIVWNT